MKTLNVVFCSSGKRLSECLGIFPIEMYGEAMADEQDNPGGIVTGRHDIQDVHLSLFLYATCLEKRLKFPEYIFCTA